MQTWLCQLRFRYWKSGKSRWNLSVLLGFCQSTEDKMSTILCCQRLCIHHKSTRNSYFFISPTKSLTTWFAIIPMSSFCMSWLVLYLSPLLDNQFARSLSSLARNFTNWIKFDSLSSSPLIAIPCIASYCNDSMIFSKQRRFSSLVALAVVLVISTILPCVLGITISYSTATWWHCDVWCSWNQSKAFF